MNDNGITELKERVAALEAQVINLQEREAKTGQVILGLIDQVQALSDAKKTVEPTLQ